MWSFGILDPDVNWASTRIISPASTPSPSPMTDGTFWAVGTWMMPTCASTTRLDSKSFVVRNPSRTKRIPPYPCCRLLLPGQLAMPGSAGIPRVAVSTNTRNDCWVIGGEQYLFVWILNTADNRLRWVRVNVKKIKRNIDVICVRTPSAAAWNSNLKRQALNSKNIVLIFRLMPLTMLPTVGRPRVTLWRSSCTYPRQSPHLVVGAVIVWAHPFQDPWFAPWWPVGLDLVSVAATRICTLEVWLLIWCRVLCRKEKM